MISIFYKNRFITSTAIRFLFVYIVLGSFSSSAHAQQTKIDSITNQLDSREGIERLALLVQLIKHHQQLKLKTALKYGKQAVTIADQFHGNTSYNKLPKNRGLFIQAYFLMGTTLYKRKAFLDAKEHFTYSLHLNENFQDTLTKSRSIYFLNEIQERIDNGSIKKNRFAERLNNLRISQFIKDLSDDTKAQSEIKLGETKERLGNLNGAIENYRNAIEIADKQGDAELKSKLQLRIAELLGESDQPEAAQTFLKDVIQKIENDTLQGYDSLTTKRENLKSLADSFAANNDYENSLAYYKLYLALVEKAKEDSLRRTIVGEQRVKEIKLLKQQQKIADLTIDAATKERARQVQVRNTLFIVACLILIASLVIFYFFLMKKKQHQQLVETYDALAQAKAKLEEAEQKIVTLLKQQVSGDIADQLLVQNNQLAERHFVCILFLDIRNFTAKAQQLSPEELIAFQNEVFGFMIDIVEQHNGNINQLLGDGFMATFGAPISHGNDSQNAFDAANKILMELRSRIEESVLQEMKIGMGLHAGYVVTGNVGNSNRKQYSVTGNPVIIASRVEQLTKQYDTQLIITKEVYDQLETKPNKEDLNFTDTSLKGRAEQTTIVWQKENSKATI